MHAELHPAEQQKMALSVIQRLWRKMIRVVWRRSEINTKREFREIVDISTLFR